MHEKVDIKSILMYMEPKGFVPENDHAQCRGCMMWVKGDDLCMAHGKKVKVEGGDTCGGYAEGKPHGKKEMAMASWTPEESGLEKREVRCENCYYADNKATLCKLIEKKLADEPDTYKGDAKIIPKGCCNANHKKERVKPEEKKDGPSEGLKRITVIRIMQET